MTAEIRVWRIQKDDHLHPVKSSKLDMEARLEDWIEEDISILSNDFLVIGRQVATEYGGAIDLLCLDRQGDVVVVELKRDKSPREITAQILDYASWVKDRSREQVIAAADSYLQKKRNLSLEDAFQTKFGVELPEVLNETHNMLIVATQIDPASERIIRYLSDTYGVGINAATFQYFKDDDNGEYLARVFLIEPSQVADKKRDKNVSKRRPNLSLEELEAIAKDKGLGDIYNTLSSALEKHLKKSTTMSSLSFAGIFGNRRKAIFGLIPTESSPENGLKFRVYTSRWTAYFKTDLENVSAILPENKQQGRWSGAEATEYAGIDGYFRTDEEVKRFVAGLQKHKASS